MLSEESRAAGFTNERGGDGSILYLRNVMGLWLLQESMRTWERLGKSFALAELLSSAAAEPPLRSVFDPGDPRFFPPGDMPSRIAQVCREHGEPVAETPAQVTRSILDSLALAYRRSLRAAAELSGRAVEVVHVVGGGVNNTLLCQLTSDACGLPVVAGPVEAAAIGNALVQAQALGTLRDGRWAIRGARLQAGGAPPIRAVRSRRPPLARRGGSARHGSRRPRTATVDRPVRAGASDP